MWSRLSRFYKSEMSPLLKKNVVYMFEKLDRETRDQGWATISDATGAGLSNVELDFLLFMTDVLQNHYPRGPKYNAFVDLPWILNATAKLVMSFMNEELKNSMKFIKNSELPEFIDKEYIPVHLKGTFDKEVVFIPDGVKPLEELTHSGLSADQIKKIRNTFKAELK